MRSKKYFLSFCILLQVVLLVACGGKRTHSAPVSYELPVATVEYPVCNVPQLDASHYNCKVEVCFSGGEVKTSVLPSGVTADCNGAGVVLRSELEGVEYVVRGDAADGSLTIVSRHSPLVTLDGVSLVAHGRNAFEVSSEGVIYLRASGCSSIADVSDGSKAGNQSAAVKLVGQAVLCGGSLAVNAERRSALLCTGTLYMDGMQLSLDGAPNNAVVTNGSFVVAAGKLNAFSSKDVVKCKKGDFVMLGGSVSLSSMADKADGVQAENFYLNGGSLDIVVSGAASDGVKAAANLCVGGGDVNVVTRGSALFNNKKSDYSSSSCFKSDAVVEIDGGKCCLRSEGDGAKGISCDSIIVVKGGDVSVVTKGGEVNDPVDINAHTSPKGIKSDGSIYLAGGNVEVLVFGEDERSEGVETKKELHVSGECNLYVYAYDDAINAGNMLVAGGKVYVYSVANDAIDSNGELRIDSGVVVADGSSSPEQGVDVDNYSLFSVRGGVLFSVGGSMGQSPAVPLSDKTSVPAFAWSGPNLEKGKFLSLVDADGEVLYSYKVQRSMPNAACVVASSLLNGDAPYAFVVSGSLEGGKYEGDGLYAGGKPQGVAQSVGFEPKGLVNVVDINGNVTLCETGNNIGGMPPPPPHGMFPGDSVAMSGHGFPPPPPHGMFPGDSTAMSGHGFPPPPPPPPMRRIKNEFSEGNLPNYDNG